MDNRLTMKDDRLTVKAEKDRRIFALVLIIILIVLILIDIVSKYCSSDNYEEGYVLSLRKELSVRSFFIRRPAFRRHSLLEAG